MLLDIRMPGKSGLEVMRDADPMPPYPVIAMTGHVDAEALAEFRCVPNCVPRCSKFMILQQAVDCDCVPLHLRIVCLDSCCCCCRKAKFSGCLGKPFNSQSFVETILRNEPGGWFATITSNA